jgi:hypothetical protein
MEELPDGDGETVRYVRAAAKVVASISATQNGKGHLKAGL